MNMKDLMTQKLTALVPLFILMFAVIILILIIELSAVAFFVQFLFQVAGMHLVPMNLTVKSGVVYIFVKAVLGIGFNLRVGVTVFVCVVLMSAVLTMPAMKTQVRMT